MEGGSTTADHAHITPLEPAKIVVFGTMREGIRRQMGEASGQVREIAYPDRNNDSGRQNRLAVIELQDILVVRGSAKIDQHLFFDVWNELFLECKPVMDKGF